MFKTRPRMVGFM